MTQLKAGIDAGGSLVKIVYQEKQNMHYRKFPIAEMDAAISWLKMLAPDLKVALTGGKAHKIQQRYFPNGLMVPEFQATFEGTRMLLLEKGKQIASPFIVINIGTGTSWYLINGDGYERILGSGIGGGTFTGLGSLLTNIEDFHQLADLTSKGEKGNVDLLVKDIYESAETPINGNLSAANFAKGNTVKNSNADRLTSLANMIAETVTLLTLQAAAMHHVKEVILIGSTLVGFETFVKMLTQYMEMVGLSAAFLNRGEYCGAIGAFLSV